MNGPSSHDTDGVSDAERSLLRKSVRDLLANIWPADKVAENSGNAQAIATLWPAMARQGLASLGSNAGEVGLREIVLVFEELGRASCPAPLLGAVAANLALATQHSNARADEPGSGRVSSARPRASSDALCARTSIESCVLLADLHQGNATVALALGNFDGDPAAGRVVVAR